MTTTTVRRSVGVRDDDTFEQNVHAVATYVAVHGHLPSRIGEYAHLGEFIYGMRRASRGTGRCHWDESRRALLDRFVPDWNTPRRRGARPDDTRFRQRAEQVAAHHTEHGHFPTTSENPSLSRWLTSMRRAARGCADAAWTPEREALLDTLIPGWNTP